MEKPPYQDISKEINYDVAEVFEVKFSKVEDRKKEVQE